MSHLSTFLYISFSIKCENVAKPLGNFNVFQNASTVLARQASPNILCAVGACFRLRSIKTGRGPSPLAVGGWRRKYVCVSLQMCFTLLHSREVAQEVCMYLHRCLSCCFTVWRYIHKHRTTSTQNTYQHMQRSSHTHKPRTTGTETAT